MELVWVDGLRSPVKEEAWERTAATFYGVGYRTNLPVVENMSEPVSFHRNLAEKLASTLERPLDRSPWDFIEAGNFPVGSAIEVVGGWPSPGVAFGEPAGDTAWTAIAPIAPSAHGATFVDSVSLPWKSNPMSPMAGLPTLSRLEDYQAARHVKAAHAKVGLWWNAANHLTGSTAGVPLVQQGRRSWIFPSRIVGIVSSWVFFNIANALSAMPEIITMDTLRGSRATVCISGTGDVSVLNSIDGQPLTSDREQVLELLTTRLRFLA